MQTEEVEKILKHTLKSTFVGVYAKDEIPNTMLRHMGIIVNTDPSSKPGTHWVTVFFFCNGEGEVSIRMDDILFRNIERYLSKHALNVWSYNIRVMQSRISALCGAYCLPYLQARNSKQTLSLKPLVDRFHTTILGEMTVMYSN